MLHPVINNNTEPRPDSSPKQFKSRQGVMGKTALVLFSCFALLIKQVASSNIPSQAFSDQQQPQHQHQQLQQSPTFDPSAYKNIHDAIRGHPDLREFSALCQSEGVKEIISMDKTALTVFAPIDSSLVDLLTKSKSRNSINLIELAKHHIAQGFITPDENTKYPLRLFTYSNLSPLYLTQSQQQNGVFVNNAKILATHLIPIDGDNYQTLHIIDQALEFAFTNRKTQLRSSTASGQYKTTTVKRSLSLDDLASPSDSLAAFEFYERFGDIQTNKPSVDLYHARIFKGTQQQSQQRITLGREEFNLERLMKLMKQHQQLRGRMFQVNESNSFNTYFLPLNTEELDSMLDGIEGQNGLIYEAFVIPDEVLFTRTMNLGQSHETLFSRDSNSHKVSLSLAKTMSQPVSSSPDDEFVIESEPALSRKFLTTPLLLQAKCSQQSMSLKQAHQANNWRSGITNAEILVANIPLSNGVLHLIKRPVLVSDTNVLDYLNDNDNQLSNVVNSIGTQTSPASKPINDLSKAVKVNKFRELLARERQMLSTLSMDPSMNKTILAPSDEAFAKLRFDLRALVSGDESLIPKHWDPSYRHDLLERLAKRHIVLHQTITSDQMNQQQQILSENGKLLSFSESPQESGSFQVESDATVARLVHHDLIGTNGVLHIIDRVLGEDQETVHSLLKSIVLKFNHSLEEINGNQFNDLNQLIQANLKSRQDLISVPTATPTNSISEHNNVESINPELALISKSISQYLDELSSNNRRQLQLLSSSVNISYQLARLTSLAEGLDDWNEKFKHEDNMFTYFVPSDLAWIKLQQSQPELYKPLMYFLDSQQGADGQQAASVGDSNFIEVPVANSASKSPRSSESSHRLRQILERHLVVNRKLAKKDLSQMDSLQTLGATLRLVDSSTNGQQLTVNHNEAGSSSMTAPMSTFAALHSIVTGANNNNNNQPAQQTKLKALRLDGSNANIVQVNEASNGFVYVIDNVLLLPEDSDYIVQTSQSPAISSTMSSLLGAHNSAILNFIQTLLAPSSINMSASSILVLIGTLTLAIAVLLVLAIVLVVRKSRRNKLNRHQQLESGLTSSSSANSGSTSTTKSL